jgi:diaminohydroxyphosphoribosylaminopyrimidine deaminase / 5-amino-6-(5-phosphoribosylamino)uracil reductase
MLMSDVDDALLAQAIALAARAIGLSDPNPRVGCILVDRDGSTPR